MTILDEINKEKQSQLDIISKALMAAAEGGNRNVAGMAAKVTELRTLREVLDNQEYTSAMDSPAMAHALTTFKEATDSMKKTAAQMTSATVSITHVNNLVSSVTKAVSILKG